MTKPFLFETVKFKKCQRKNVEVSISIQIESKQQTE